MRVRGRELHPVINDEGFVVMTLEQLEDFVQMINESIPISYLSRHREERVREIIKEWKEVEQYVQM